MQVERPALLVFDYETYNGDMHCVYVIKNLKFFSIYIGYTSNLKRRLIDHNSNQSKFTKSKGKWELVYCEIYRSKKDAVERERKLKQHGSSFGHLKKRILNSLNED